MIADLKPYAHYKASSQAWLGEVPRHWALVPNRALFAEVKDRNHANEEMLSVTIARGIVRQKALLEGSSKKDSSNVDKSAYKLVQPHDIAYNKMRAWQGAIGASALRGIVSPAYVVMRLRKDDGVANYFHHLYRTSQFATEVERWSYGITSDMWSLRPEHFKMIYTPEPPPEEQAAIVRFLDWANGRLERAIRAKRKVIELLNEQKQAIIHRAVTRGLDPSVPLKPSGIAWLGDIPRHWESRRLKWVLRLQRGFDLPADRRTPGIVPVYSSGGHIDNHDVALAASPGVVIGRYGSTDAVFFVTEPYWPHNTALFTTSFYNNHARWCFYLLRSIGKGAYAGKSAVPGVDRKDLFDIVVPRPPVGEQRAIAESIDEDLAAIDHSIESIDNEIKLLREYRTRLVYDVATGKLDVREAAARLPDEVSPNTVATDTDANDEIEFVTDEVGAA